MFEPLKITAYLQCGVVSSDCFLPIDAILRSVAMRKKYGYEQVTIPGGTIFDEHLNNIFVPLKQKNMGSQWYYAASFAQWPEVTADGRDYWNKRFDSKIVDLIDFRNRRGNVIINRGRYRAYHMPIFYRHALYLNWYVLGEKREIEELLKFVTHIGKKISQGWGRILNWEVEKFSKDWSEYNDNGKLMRAIPAKEGILFGFRPSYWLPENQTICKIPGI